MPDNLDSAVDAWLRGGRPTPPRPELPDDASAVARAAHARGFIDPGDAEAMVDATELETDDDVAAAVDQLARRKPHLLTEESQPLPAGGFGGGQRGGFAMRAPNMNERIREALNGPPEGRGDGWHGVDTSPRWEWGA